MISRLSHYFPAKASARNEKGITIIELLVSMIILCLVCFIILGGLVAYLAKPTYKGTAYTVENGQKYYNFVRLPEKGMIGGVCAGIAYKWGMSPWIPRLVFIVVSACGGAGILAYLAIWVLTNSAHAPDDFMQRTGG